jgi:heme/copper-type cytochrome/quinol oxidase subunit 2
MMSVIMIQFSSSKVGIVHKYHNHGTLIELIWTITPALILIAIAFPSFKLLYLMDILSSIELDLYHLAMGSPVALPVLRKVPVKYLKSSCTSLVLKDAPNTLGSTTGINLNTHVRNITTFSKPIVSQLVGHLLGDGALTNS